MRSTHTRCLFELIDISLGQTTELRPGRWSPVLPSAILPAMSIGVADTGALTGQIRQIKQQLDDWTTCVSAKTTKGQAEIQRLSGEMSAVTQQLQRLAATQPSQPSSASSASPARLLDVWA